MTVRIPDTLSFPSDPEQEFTKINNLLKSFVNKKLFLIHAYVFMYDHFHLLISTSLENTEKIQNINELFTEKVSAIEVQWKKIDNFKAYQETYRYIYNNPLKHGYCQRLMDYPYSSYIWLMGQKKAAFPILDQMNLITQPQIVSLLIQNQNLAN